MKECCDCFLNERLFKLEETFSIFIFSFRNFSHSTQMKGQKKHNILILRFTACNANQYLKGMELQEKVEEKDIKHLGKLFRKTQR